MRMGYGDDEGRSDATHFSPALRVAAEGGHLLRRDSSAYSWSEYAVVVAP